jgi:hypothetical protein
MTEFILYRNGNLQMLSEGLKAARALTPAGLGIPVGWIETLILAEFRARRVARM